MEKLYTYLNKLLIDKNIDVLNFHKLLLENLNSILNIKSVPDLKYVYVNHSFSKLLGINPEDIIGKTAKDIFPKAQAIQYEASDEQAIQTKQVIEITADFIKDKNQIIHTFNTKKIPICDSNGNVQFILTISSITTDNKEEEIKRFRARFTSLITHELRNPLTTIMLSTDLLRSRYQEFSEEERDEHFGRIQNTILNMTQLMEKILTLSNMEMDRYNFQPERTDIYSFFKSIADNVQFVHQNSCKINVTFEGECNYAEADETLLNLIINNLLTNACKYSPPNSEIHFDTTFNENYIIVKIKDNGIGIPKEDLPYLFEPFYRASNTGNTRGYGIGLSIVKKCVELHKGTISVESELGKGTTFTLTLPIKFANG